MQSHLNHHQQQHNQQQQHHHHQHPMHSHHQQQQHHHSDLMDNKGSLFIFEDTEVGDLCDGILSDSNESNISSETNGTTNLSLAHQQSHHGHHGQHHHHHHQQHQQQQQQQQQHHQQRQQQPQQNSHQRETNVAGNQINLNGVGYHQADHHHTNGLGSIHLNGTTTPMTTTASPGSATTTIMTTAINPLTPGPNTPPSGTSSPLSNHSNESPISVNSNSSGRKRELPEFLGANENGTSSGPTEPLAKKMHTNGKKTKGRVKIKMEFIHNKLRRYTTFSKRKSGIMKKAFELATLTGTQVMLLVASETGHVYTFATKKLKPMITSEAGKALIKTCLFSPEPQTDDYDEPRMTTTGYEETELSYSVNDDSSEKDEDSSSSQGIFSPSSVNNSGSVNQSINGPSSSGQQQSTPSSHHPLPTSSSSSVTLSTASSPSLYSSSYHNNSLPGSSSSPQGVALALTSTANLTTSNASSLFTSSSISSSVSTSSTPPSSLASSLGLSFLPVTSSSANSLINSLSTSSPLELSSVLAARSSLGSSSIAANNSTGTTFTAAILGGVLPPSALLNGNHNYQGSPSVTNNPAAIFKLPDFGASALTTDSRLAPKVTSPATLFNTGSVVLCTNQSGSNNAPNSVPSGTALMYHTPQGVVYATAAPGNPNAMFPENLILNFGQNLAAAAVAAAAAANNTNSSNISSNNASPSSSSSSSSLIHSSVLRSKNQTSDMISNDTHHTSHNQNKAHKSSVYKKLRK